MNPALQLNNSFFGSIALKNRVLKKEQLAEALKIQWERAQGGLGPTLGEVCLELGFLNEKQVRAVLAAQTQSALLLEDTLWGKIAVRNGLITEQQLEAALTEQKQRGPGARLGHILIERSELTSQQALDEAATRVACRVLTWKEGQFAYWPEESAPPPGVNADVGLEDLALERWHATDSYS